MMVDLTNIPDKYIKKRNHFLLDGIEQRADFISDFVLNDYPNHETLQACSEFIHYDLVDVCRSDVDSLLERLGFFPWIEVEIELGETLDYILLTRFKAAWDSLRRALELTVVAVYLSSEQIPADEARKWMTSKSDTPFFSRAIKKLAKTPRFINAEESWQWSDSVKRLYWHLSNYVHCKGEKYSYRSMYSGMSRISGIYTGGIDKQVVTDILNDYIDVVQVIAILLSLYNPVILIGLPLDEKFGMNGPISGYFNESQTSRLIKILPDPQRDFLLDMAKNDPEVQSAKQWVEDMPDLTEKDFNEQADHFDQLINKFPKKDHEQGITE